MVAGVNRTPLHPIHVELGARMVDFAGWEMPLHYPTGINEEHLEVRQGTGLFDVSHMTQFQVDGPQALQFLRYALLNDAQKLRVGRAHYSMLANGEGGLVDDIYVYRTAQESYLLVGNAANREAVKATLGEIAGRFDCTVELREDRALLALQGPGAALLLERVAQAELSGLKKNRLTDMTIAGAPVLASRTGYTGEDGFELFLPARNATEVWSTLTGAGAKPCGLGCRDTLRLEAGYPLFGADLDGTTDPLCTPYAWLVKEKESYGIESLGGECSRRLVGIKLNRRGIARNGYRIRKGEEQVGWITSGTISPVTREGIAMGWVDAQYSEVDEQLGIEIRGEVFPATVVQMPFLEELKK